MMPPKRKIDFNAVVSPFKASYQHWSRSQYLMSVMWQFWNTRSHSLQEVSVPAAPPVRGTDLSSPVVAESNRERRITSPRCDVSTLKVFWSSIKGRLGASNFLSDSPLDIGELEDVDPVDPPVAVSNNDDAGSDYEDTIDNIVVDNLFVSDGETHMSAIDPGVTSTGGSSEKPALRGNPSSPTPSMDHEESVSSNPDKLRWAYFIWTALGRKLYPNIHKFFTLRFYDGKMENEFRSEAWLTSKRLALWARQVRRKSGTFSC